MEKHGFSQDTPSQKIHIQTFSISFSDKWLFDSTMSFTGVKFLDEKKKISYIRVWELFTLLCGCVFAEACVRVVLVDFRAAGLLPCFIRLHSNTVWSPSKVESFTFCSVDGVFRIPLTLKVIEHTHTDFYTVMDLTCKHQMLKNQVFQTAFKWRSIVYMRKSSNKRLLFLVLGFTGFLVVDYA